MKKKFKISILILFLLLIPVLKLQAQVGTCKNDRVPVDHGIITKEACDKLEAETSIELDWNEQKIPSRDPALTPTEEDKASETNPPYTLLEPIPCIPGPENPNCGEDGKLRTFNPEGEAKLSEYLNLIITLIIGLCAVGAVVMIVIAGVEYSTSGLISSKEAAKERIRNALFGLLLALGSYTILYTINPDLLIVDVGVKPVTLGVELQEFQIDTDTPQTPEKQIINGKPESVVTGRYNNSVVGQTWSGDSPALPNGVTLKEKECKKVGDGSCASIKGLNLGIINSIQANCPNKCGDIVITGGTEFWQHSKKTTHGSESATVDLRTANGNSELDKYLLKGEPIVIDKYYDRGDISCRYERNKGASGFHWHCLLFSQFGAPPSQR